MLITQKGFDLPEFAWLLDDNSVVWPIAEVAISSDVLAVEVRVKQTGHKKYTTRTFLLNLEYCGELLRALTAPGATVHHAAIFSFKTILPASSPFKITEVTEIRLGKRRSPETDIAFLKLAQGRPLIFPVWGASEPIADEITIFSNNEQE